NRMSSHLVWMATNGMDLGSTSMMIYGLRERELILAFFEKTAGLRLNLNYVRPGGVAADLPDGWQDDVLVICDTIFERTYEYDQLFTGDAGAMAAFFRWTWQREEWKEKNGKNDGGWRVTPWQQFNGKILTDYRVDLERQHRRTGT